MNDYEQREINTIKQSDKTMTREEQIDNACTNWICSQENGTVIMARDVWRAAVEWADSHPQWIPVDERLPKMEIDDWRSDDLLFVTSDGIRRYGFCSNRGAWFSSVMGFAASQVTHWMPLPAAPRKEE